MKKRVWAFLLILTVFASTIWGNGFVTNANNTDEIVAFADKMDLEIVVEEKGTLSDVQSMLPDTLEVYNEVKEKILLPVTWTCEEDYENTRYFYYYFTPVWDEQQYTVSEDTYVPGAWVSFSNRHVSFFAATDFSNETVVYEFLREKMGCNMATAVGILANIERESNYNPTASIIDTNGLTSYGICQWNGARFTALKNYCEENGYEYSSLEGQLNYLKYELSTAEIGAWSKLQGLEDTAVGAYTVGYYWAQYFERCAVVYREVSAKRARDIYWPEYSKEAVGVYNEPVIAGVNVPSTLKEGSAFSIRGLISCDQKITNVTVGCYDVNGNMQISQTASDLNTTVYNVSSLDSKFEINKLTPGIYYYRITATVGEREYVLVNEKITILTKDGEVPANNVPVIEGANKPGTLTEGSAFSIRGTISCDQKITKVTVGCYDKDDNAIISQTASNLNTNEYNIRNLDAKFEFNKLTPGVYYYRITATSGGKEYVLVNSEFTILTKDGEVPANSVPVIEGANKPGTLTAGSAFSIRGTISCDQKITKVTVGCYDKDDNAIISQTASNLNTNEYNIKNLDAKFEFNKLTPGVYYYRITATAGGKEYVLVNSEFTILTKDGEMPTNNIPTISGANVPGTLTVGSTFSIRGTINCDQQITKVTVGCYDVNGDEKIVQTASNLNTKEYNVKNLDAKFAVNKLSAGIYYYRIKATVGEKETVLVDSVFTVLTKSQTIADGTYVITTYEDNNLAVAAADKNSSSVTVKGRENSKLQQLVVKYLGSGYYSLQFAGSGKMLTSGKNVQQTASSSSDAQKWQILPVGNSYCLIPKSDTSLCLTVNDEYVETAKTSLDEKQRVKFTLYENPFEDVAKTDYYYEPIMWALDNEIANGTTMTKFSPEKIATRGDIVTFLWRAAGTPEVKNEKNPFKDVSPEAYYYKAVLWAVEKGITNGISEECFEPGRECTRAQAVTFLWRMAGKPGTSGVKNQFEDVKTEEFYYDAVLWAVKESITSGESETTFAPDKSCKRGEIVTFLYRYYN